MSNLSGKIEEYLKMRLAEQEAGMLEIQRSLLSELFACVPSQINYVLSTRFTPRDGYLVETRRGGGGYVRIIHIPIEDNDDLSHLYHHIGRSIGEREEESVINRLVETGLINLESANLMKSLFKDRVMKLPPLDTADELRAYLLKNLLANLSIPYLLQDE